MFNGYRDNQTPFRQRFPNRPREIAIEQQVVQGGIAPICFDDPVQKSRANDAATSPDGGDVAQVELPLVFSASRAQKLHSLRIRHNFRRVKRIAYRIDEPSAIGFELPDSRLWQNFRRSDPLFFS